MADPCKWGFTMTFTIDGWQEFCFNKFIDNWSIYCWYGGSNNACKDKSWDWKYNSNPKDHYSKDRGRSKIWLRNNIPRIWPFFFFNFKVICFCFSLVIFCKTFCSFSCSFLCCIGMGLCFTRCFGKLFFHSFLLTLRFLWYFTRNSFTYFINWN